MIIKKCEFHFTRFILKYLDNNIILFTHHLNQILYYRLCKKVGQGISVGQGGGQYDERGEFQWLLQITWNYRIGPLTTNSE